MEKIEQEIAKLKEMNVSVQLYWALENILGLSKDDIKTIKSHYPTTGRMLKKIMKVKDWRKFRK